MRRVRSKSGTAEHPLHALWYYRRNERMSEEDKFLRETLYEYVKELNKKGEKKNGDRSKKDCRYSDRR